MPVASASAQAEADRVAAVSKAAVDAYGGQHRRELRELYEERDTQLLKMHAARAFSTEPYWQTYVRGLLARLREANPAYVSPAAQAYVLHSGSVNAACYGEGSVSVNLGLVARLASDDELAFVLTHELAHQYLGHLDERIAAHVDRLYGKDAQRELRQLKRGGGGFDEVEAFAKTFALEGSRHSRFGESAADSLGLRLYLAAGFAAAGPVRVMEVLAKADTADYTAELPIAELLSTPQFTFDPRVLRKPVELFATATGPGPAERDSLSTHPDTELRKADLAVWTDERATVLPQGLATDAAGTDAVVAERAETRFAERRLTARRELAAAHFRAGDLGAALYAALRLVDDGRDEGHWARGVAALSLYRIARAREDNRMTAHVRLPRHATADEGYETLLRGIHALRRRELSALAVGYARHYAAQYPQCVELQLAQALVGTLDETFTAATRRKSAQDFGARFPDSPYRSLLNDAADPWLATD